MTTAATKDVQLRIRARDYSQKTFKDLQSAYNALLKVQEIQADEAKRGVATSRELEKAYDRLADAGKQLLKIESLTRVYEAQNKALAEARDRTQEAREKLKQLNAEYENSEKKSKKQEAALARQGRAVEKLTTAETKRSDTVRRITAELERYGVSTENISQVQGQIVGDVNRVNAALERQEAALDSLSVNRAAEKIRQDNLKAAEDSEKAANRIIEALERQADQAIATSRGYRTLGRVITQTNGQTNSLSNAIQDIVAPGEAARRTIVGLENQIEDLDKTVRQNGRSTKDLKKDLQELGEAQRRLISIANLVEQFRNQTAALRATRNEYNAAKNEVRELANQLRTAGANVGDLGTKLQTAQQRLRNAGTDMQRLSDAARQTQAALRQAGVETNRLTEAENKLVQSATRVVTTANSAAESIRRQGTEAKKTKTLLDSLADSGRESLSLYQRIRGEVIALATAYVGFQGAINLAGGAIDSFKLREQSLIKISTVVGNSQEALAKQWEYMTGLADKLGLRLDVLAPAYTNFASAAAASGMTLQETQFIFESFSKSAAVLRLSQADMEGTFRAIQQVISKGQVYAEELQGQLAERLPGAVALFAKATERSVAELNKALENGEVTSRELINFAEANAARIDAQLATADKSVNAVENRLANAQLMFKLAIADAGFIDAYANALTKLTAFLNSSDGKQLAISISDGFTALAEAIGWVAENIDTVERILVTLISLKVGAWLVGMGASAIKVGADFFETAKKLKTAVGGFGKVAEGATKATGALGILRIALSGLLRFIPLVGLAFLAFDLGSLVYQTEIGKKAIDGLLDMLKKIPATLEALLLTVPALMADIGMAITGGLIDTIGKEAINKWHKMVEDFVREIPVVGEVLGDAVAKLNKAFNENDGSFFSNVTQVWEGAAEDWDAINNDMVKSDKDKYDQMLQQARDFADKVQKVTNVPIPLASSPLGFKGAPFRSPDQQPDFMFTENPGTGTTKREREIAALTKSFDKLAKAAEKANVASKEMEQRRSLSGRLALIDDEFAPLLKQAQAIGGAEGAALVKRLKEIITLRKTAETREFGAQNQGREEQQLNALRKLQEEYDRLFASIVQKSAKIDPTMTFEQRMTAALKEMNVQYDQLIAKADKLGNVEGKALAEKFEKLRATNAEYLTEKSKMDELARLQRETNAAIATKKSLVEQVNSLREAGTISENEQVARIVETNQALNAGILANLTALEQFTASAQASLTPEKFAQINAEIAAMRAGLTDVSGTFTEMDTTIVQGTLDGMGVALNSVVDSLAQVVAGTASWGDVFKNLGASIARFFADLMIKLAQAILTQMLLNAISGAGWGGISSAASSLGGVASSAGTGAVTTMHNGGIVGDKSSGSGFQSRAGDVSWFRNAPRFHSGGLPGLRSDEIPAILQKGEQVLSKDDPDNLLNSGGRGANAMPNPTQLSVINTIDPESFVTEGLGTAGGSKAFLNLIRANKSTIKTLLG